MPIAMETFMQRCFDLARLGAGRTSPNPLVGAVLVYENRIIGEGFHTQYGAPHAEVEAIRAVRKENHHLISKSTLYVSLEPCSIFGRTPPCTDLIIQKKIPKVVISYLDFTPGVNGLGVSKLRKHGVEVIENLLPKAGELLNRPRNIFVSRHRPYIILKYACTQNGYLANADGTPIWLSNAYSKRLVHRWRSEIDAIMVGTTTALLDNPKLNTRLHPGSSPIRVIPDRNLRLPLNLNIFDDSIPTLLFTQKEPPRLTFKQTEYIRLESEAFYPQMLKMLHDKNIQTLMLEGGKSMLDSFIEEGYWDEARIFKTQHQLSRGLSAPEFGRQPDQQFQLEDDQLLLYHNLD